MNGTLNFKDLKAKVGVTTSPISLAIGSTVLPV